MPLLKAAYDRGINTWDTANVYSQGVSEIIVGKAIKKYRIPREKVIVMTKCFWGVGEEPDVRHFLNREAFEKSKDYVNQYHLSRAAIFNQVNASLKRLDTDYIDVLQIHRFDYNTPLEETMKALHDLVESGKVRYIGASSMYATCFARLQFTAEKNGCKFEISSPSHLCEPWFPLRGVNGGRWFAAPPSPLLSTAATASSVRQWTKASLRHSKHKHQCGTASSPALLRIECTLPIIQGYFTCDSRFLFFILPNLDFVLL